MQRKKPLDSFRYAGEGILHCFRTQKHMQIHFVLMVLCLLSALMVGMDKRDVILLMICITLVIGAEMVNTAIETVVDMITQQYHPLAKLAKDVAAGAAGRKCCALLPSCLRSQCFFCRSTLLMTFDK